MPSAYDQHRSYRRVVRRRADSMSLSLRLRLRAGPVARRRPAQPGTIVARPVHVRWGDLDPRAPGHPGTAGSCLPIIPPDQV